MTMLNEIPAELDPTHLLLIGQTKAGKSTYSAQAVLDGWPMVYIDSDNGLSALRRAMKGNEAAMSRVMYIGTEKPCEFLEGFLDNPVYRWNLTQDREYAAISGKPGDKILEVRPALMPKRIILNVDSWSAISLDAMQIGADNKKTSLEDMANQNKSQQVYGDAALRLTKLLAILQRCGFHTIIQAHPTFYERYEKPLNKTTKETKQSDMILRESIEIPLSCSKPHGHSMGKFFTDIGWLELNRMDERILSFKAVQGRISGGTVATEGRVGEMSFSKLFQPNPPSGDEIDFTKWSRYLTHEEFVAEREAAKESKVKPAGASPSGVTATPVLPSKPANPLLNFGKAKAS